VAGNSRPDSLYLHGKNAVNRAGKTINYPRARLDREKRTRTKATQLE
jgi:hypothetical protein